MAPDSLPPTLRDRDTELLSIAFVVIIAILIALVASGMSVSVVQRSAKGTRPR